MKGISRSKLAVAVDIDQKGNVDVGPHAPGNIVAVVKSVNDEQSVVRSDDAVAIHIGCHH